MPRHVLLAVLVVICFSCQSPNTSAAPTRQEIWNATYSDLDVGTITLRDGRWTGSSDNEGLTHPYVEVLYDFIATGDIDRDDSPEAAVVINESGGGSGQFRRLILFDRVSGRIVQAGQIALGDRIQVKSIRFEPGNLLAEIVRSTGPLCCPDEVVRFRFPYAGHHFGEPSETMVIGSRYPAVLAGSNWTAEGQISLTYESGQLRGNAGCNRYSAPVTEAESPGSFTLGPIATTRMMCSESTMESEATFLKRLQAATTMWFSPDRLHLGYEIPGDDGALVFDSQSPEQQR